MATKKKLARKKLTPSQLAEERALFAEQVVTGMVVAKTICHEVFDHTNTDMVLKIFGFLEFDDDGNPPEDTGELVAQLKEAKEKTLEIFEHTNSDTVVAMHEHMHEEFVSSDDLADEE